MRWIRGADLLVNRACTRASLVVLEAMVRDARLPPATRAARPGGKQRRRSTGGAGLRMALAELLADPSAQGGGGVGLARTRMGCQVLMERHRPARRGSRVRELAVNGPSSGSAPMRRVACPSCCGARAGAGGLRFVVVDNASTDEIASDRRAPPPAPPRTRVVVHAGSSPA